MTLRVLRIYHSGVVAAYRQRDREMQARGVNVTLVTAKRWNEGGRDVTLDPEGDDFVVGARTVGRHPYRFVYDPSPIWRLLRAGRFDVIDVHEEPASLAAGEIMVLRRLLRRGVPLTLYSAQNLPKRYPPPFRWIERIALRSAAAVYCCNEAAAGVLRAKGFAGALPVLGLGVDVERFSPRDQQPQDPGPLHVGYVGRLQERKGVRVLLDAVAAVPAATLAFVGGGPDREHLVAEVARLGLGERVQARSFVAHDELPGVYREFDVICVPSIATPGWIEQFGRVAVEAMASGVPVIASDVGSLPEVVGDAGILVPPGDVDALAAALRRLDDDPQLRHDLAERGRKRAERFSWRAIAEAHHGVYLEALQ